MLEGFGAERMSVADLDAEALQEGRIDRLRGSRRPGFGRVLRQFAGAGGVELFLGPDFHLVEAADSVLGPPG